MNYILDTNVFIHIMQNKTPNLLKKISQQRGASFYLSSITEAELWYGVANSKQRMKNEELLIKLLSYFVKLPFNSVDAEKYGSIKFEQMKSGKVIGPYDLLIATQAIELDAILITANEKEFKQIRNLKVENWLK